MTRAAQDDDEVPDLGLLRDLAGIELAAVASHQAIAGRGLLDPTIAGLSATFAAHHQAHAATLNAILASLDREPVTVAAPALGASLDPLIAGALDATALLQVAHAVERTVAATHVDAIGRLALPELSATVARILPVEAQHAAVLAVALGLAPDEGAPGYEPLEASILDA